MQKLRTKIRPWLLLMMVPVMAQCGGDPIATLIISSIAVTPGTPTMSALGRTQQFIATARDQNGQLITGRSFTWASSATTVATVNSSTGMATAVGNGTTTISASADGVSGSAVLEVSQVVTQTTVTADGGTTTLTSIGQTVQLTADPEDSGGSSVSNASATWTSSDDNVVTVTNTGLATAVGDGTATITADVSGVMGTIDVTVSQTASQLGITQQPSTSAASGIAFAQQPIVQLQDANGNGVPQSGVTVSASLASGGGTLGGTVSVTTDGNGTAAFSDLNITGSAGSRTLQFTSDPLTAATSSAIALGAGTVDPGNSTITVPVNTTAGAVTTVTVDARDAFGNPVGTGGDNVAVTITGANPGTPAVTDNGDGSYTATYTPQTAGTDNLAATINGAAVGNSPAATTVGPGAADGASSTAIVASAAAGNPTNVTVQARDVFGNPLTGGGATVVVSVTGTNNAAPGVNDNGDGTYSSAYVPTTPGTDMIAITLNGTPISGSPFTNIVGLGAADAGQTTASVPAGTSGQVTSMVVQSRDAGGNILTSGGEIVIINVTGANSIAPGVTDNGDGTYTANYTPIVAGTDNISITLNGAPISGSPYTSSVAAGALDPTKSTATVPPNGISGLQTVITVTGRDLNSNPISTGGATVVANVTGANNTAASVTDNNDGTYTVNYTPSATGTDNISITIGGASISGSPFITTIVPGAADPTMTTAAVSPSSTAGSLNGIVVTTRDVNGNALTTGGATVAIVISGANPATPTVTDAGDGTYSAIYTPTVAGTDNIAITLNGVGIGGGPYTTQVTAAAVVAAQSTATVPTGLASGQVSNIVVTARDTYGNALTTGGSTVVVTVTGSNPGTPAVTDNVNGTYSASYTPTVAGADTVNITLGGSPISGVPFATVIGTGAADAGQSSATVPAGTAGVATSITVQTADANGNLLTVGGEAVVVSVTGANTATPTVTDNNDGTYSASYTPTVSGADNVAITLNGNPLGSSPFASTVAAAALDPAQSTAVAPAGVAGNQTDIVITGRDAFGNAVSTGGATVLANVTGANTATATITDNADGTYTASYTPTLVGTDNIAITIDAIAISGSPVSSLVGPGAVDAAQTTATVPATGTSGAATNIVVQGRDANGNAVTIGGATVVIDVSGANTATPTVTDNTDGTYSASYTPTVAGADNIAITLGGVAISSSPFTSTVGAGAVDAAQTTAVVPAGTSGIATNITVQARDANGNPLTTGGSTVVVDVTGANTATPTVTDNNDGTYTTNYTPSIAGTDNIAITLDGGAINGSPFSSVVSPGAADPTQTTGTVPAAGSTGIPTNIAVQAKDAAGNNLTTGGATVVVTVTGANAATPTVTDNDDGTYSTSYTPTAAGADNIAITLNGAAINGSPFASTVTVSGVDPAQSTASVAASLTAGTVSNITVTALDGAGIQMTTGGETVVVDVTGSNPQTPAVTDNNDGTYTTSYTPTVAGTDTVAITINAVAIGSSPFETTVNPGTLVNALFSTIAVPDSGTAGDTTWINIIARDSLGNRVAAGGETVIAFVFGNHLENPPVSDSGNGAYVAPFVPTISGTDEFEATINGVNVGGGPYTSFARPDSASAPNTTAVVPASGAANAVTNILVTAKDEFDNSLTRGGDTVVVSITGANTATPVVTDNLDGTYSATYTPLVAGVDNIAITLNSGAISGSPFTSTIGAGAADPTQSTATVPDTGTVGVATNITVQAVDGGGTPLTTGGEIVAVFVSGTNTDTLTVTDVGDGTYTTSYTPALAGPDAITITMNNVPISGSPFAIDISTGGASAPNSYAIVTNGTIGTPTSIFVQARDAGDNNITVGGDTIAITVTGANAATPVVTDNGDGTYTASYTPTANGTDDVAITLNSTAIFGSSYTSEVSAVTALSGRISYESDSDGGYDVWIINENGSDPINLTNSPFSSDERPHISPDGTKIVFNSDRDGDQDIYVMNSNGSGVVQLTNNPGRDRLPVWSPDGNQILFLSEEFGDSEIMVMNANGSGQTAITSNGEDDFQPDWSPDGSQIVFYRGLDVWIMNANGTGETNLTNSPSAADVETSWGPGGITFISDRDGVANGSSEIYSIQPDGTGLTRLTNDLINDFIPSWSSDGRITWITERDGSGFRGEIWIMNADGTGGVRVTTDTGAEWAPKFQP